ncbi:hypothetical protein EDB85DRAFT_2286673 [Lactarius pseudohatsudake]|nr:hypothetical protein EDB85DRAFT_2286673 [Lactarius pseudohatsudake]
MTDVMVKTMVEVLDILATATEEMKQCRANLDIFLKKAVGVTNLEGGIKKLDKLTNEEARLANAVVLKVTHMIDEKAMEVSDGVKAVEKNVVGAQAREIDENILGVRAKVKDVDGEVQVVNNSVKVIEENSLDGKAIAEEMRLDTQRTADDIDDTKRNQLRDSLKKWQSSSDPPQVITSHAVVNTRRCSPYLINIYPIMDSDALDECPDNFGIPSDRKRVLDFVKELVDLRLLNFHIYVTSRSEIDIGDSLEPLASHTVSLRLSAFVVEAS